MSYFMFSPIKSEISIENIHSHATKSRFHRFLSKMRISMEHILVSVEINSQSWLLPKNRRQKVCDEEK